MEWSDIKLGTYWVQRVPTPSDLLVFIYIQSAQRRDLEGFQDGYRKSECGAFGGFNQGDAPTAHGRLDGGAMLKRCFWNWIAIPLGASFLGFLPLLVVFLADLGVMSFFSSC